MPLLPLLPFPFPPWLPFPFPFPLPCGTTGTGVLFDLGRGVFVGFLVGLAVVSGSVVGTSVGVNVGASVGVALASAPVRKTFIGCVANGVYTNENGYVIRIRQSGSRELLDLSRWEKKMLRITGNLLPGDNFYLTAAPVVVGPCRP